MKRLDVRSTPEIFIRYAEKSKAYKHNDADNGQIVVSSIVVFIEDATVDFTKALGNSNVQLISPHDLKRFLREKTRAIVMAL